MLLDIRKPSWRDAYTHRLDHALKTLERWQGPLNWRGWPRALVWCWVLAFIYAAGALLAGFVLGANILFTGEDAAIPPWRRALSAAGIVILGWAAFAIAKHEKRIDRTFRKAWARRIGADPRILREGVGVLVAAGVLVALLFTLGPTLPTFIWAIVAWLLARRSASNVLFFLAVAVAVPLAVAVAAGGAVAVVAAGGAVAVAGALLGALALAAAVAVWLQSEGLIPAIVDPQFAAAALLVWLAFPLLNALTDWVSWLVSRGLARHLLETVRDRRKRAWRAALFWLPAHFVFDGFFAVAFLFAVIWLVPRAFAWINMALAGMGYGPEHHLVFDLCATLTTWPEMVWLVFMLFTTLIPTLLHFGLLVTSVPVMMRPPRTLREEVNEIEVDEDVLRRAADDDGEARRQVMALPLEDDLIRRIARHRVTTRGWALLGGILCPLRAPHVPYRRPLEAFSAVQVERTGEQRWPRRARSGDSSGVGISARGARAASAGRITAANTA